MEKALLVYMTAENREEAEAIGRALVAERLAACVNVIDGMTSMFRWEGDVQKARETVLIAKTGMDRFPALRERVLSLHSYDCPCIVALPVVEGHARFLEWIADETRPR